MRNLAKLKPYAKVLVAAVGSGLVVAASQFPQYAPEIQGVLALLTVLGVYRVPNAR